MVSALAGMLPSVPGNSYSSTSLTTITVPSWQSRFKQQLLTFKTPFGITTQWMVGKTVKKSLTTPLRSGNPVSVCLANISRLSDGKNDSMCLCVALNSSLHVCAPDSEALEIPLQHCAPYSHVSNLFPLHRGLLVEISAGEGADLRRRYFALLHPDEELIRVTEIDEADRIIFSSRDIPLLVTRNHRHLKVWATLESPSEESHLPDSERNGNKVLPSTQLCAFQSVLQLRLVHIQTEDIKRASSTSSSATAFLAHDLRNEMVLCLNACTTLSVFNIRMTGVIVDNVTVSYRISDAVCAAPILACRKENNAIDTLVLHSSGDISLYIAQFQICHIELTPAQNWRQGNLKPTPGKKRKLRSESLNVFQIQSDDGNWSRFELLDISFSSKLVNLCITAISCVFNAADCLPQVIPLYREMLASLQRAAAYRNSELAMKEWDVFIEALLHFPRDGKSEKKAEAAHQTNFVREISDWDFLCDTQLQMPSSQCHLQATMHSTVVRTRTSTVSNDHVASENALILTHVLNALHLIYEDRKLNNLLKMDVRQLAEANKKLAMFLGNSNFVDYYRRENGYCPESRGKILNTSDSDLYELPSIFDHLADLMAGVQRDRFPVLSFSKRGSMQDLFDKSKCANSLTLQIEEFYRCLYLPERNDSTYEENAENILLRMVKHNFRRVDLESLPFGVALPLQDALWMCRKRPKLSWSADAFLLIDREDLLPITPEPLLVAEKDNHSASLSLLRMQSIAAADSKSLGSTDGTCNITTSVDSSASQSFTTDAEDGCEMADFIFTLRFGRDRRLSEVRRMLRSTTPVVISPNLEAAANGESDGSEFEEKLLNLLQKRVAAPVGRGAFTLRTFMPADPTKPLVVPEICMTGRLYGQKFAKLNLTDSSAIDTDWGEFHNGVASGLRLVAPDSTRDSDNVKILTRSWIVRHKPADISASASHAGMLLALGLGGFLPALRNTDLYQYLLPRHDLTSIGLMLGLACGNRGSMHEKITKMLQVHVRAFNGAGFSMPEFSVSVDVQTAAILSLGLLYESSHKPFVLEGLFMELTRCSRYGPEVDGREGLSLAAGIAIGLVCLGGGEPLVSISKGNLVDRLAQLANGDSVNLTDDTSVPEISNEIKSSQENVSNDVDRSGLGDSDACRVAELASVNIDAVAPGALLALGLMYLKSNDLHIANRIQIPQNFYQLDRTRPDFVFLQVLARSMILWDDISPSLDWVRQCLPPIIQPPQSEYSSSDLCLLKTIRKDGFGRLNNPDVSGILSARAFGISGACTAIALRFAGSSDPEAVRVLSVACTNFESALQTVSKDLEDIEWLYSTCSTSCALALGVVCAGSGDLDVFRLLRRLRKRAGPSLKSKRYGRYMGMDMAVGFLFLGGGCQTFGSSKSSVAALICSIYPKFPVEVTDNQYHLQAMRHIYVLAVEPRCVETRDVDTDVPCQVDVEVCTINGATIKLTAPCIVPSSPTVKFISVVSERYLPTTIALKPAADGLGWYSSTKRQVIYVKRRPGHLSHLADPKGSKGILARSIGRAKADTCYSLSSSLFEVSDMEHLLRAFSADPEILAFARLFCSQKNAISSNETSYQRKNELSHGTSDKWRRYSQILCECLASDRSDALRCYFEAERTVSALKSGTACPSMIGSVLLSIEYLKNKRSHSPLVSDHDLSFILSLTTPILEHERLDIALGEYVRSGGMYWPEGHLGQTLGYLLRCYRVPQPVHLHNLSSRIRNINNKIREPYEQWLLCSMHLPPETSEHAFESIVRALAIYR